MTRQVKVKPQTAVMKAEELFTDRVEPQKAFWEKYDAMESEPGGFDIIHFYGIGGIGKTALLKKILTDLVNKRENTNAILYSFESEKNRDKATLLFTLAKQIEERIPDADFYLFYYAYYKLLKYSALSDEEIEAKLRKDSTGIVASRVTEAVKGALTIGTDFMPVLGNTAGYLGEKLIDLIEDKIAKKRIESDPQIISYIEEIDYISSGDESDIEKKLDDYFATCCIRTLENTDKPFVIMLDAYEFMSDMLVNDLKSGIQDLWLSGTGTDNNPGLVERLPNVLWVIAGREKLRWGENVIPQEDTHLLGNLSITDAREYFLKAKNSNLQMMSEELIKGLYELTRGTPVFMDMCFEIFERGNAEVIDDFGMDAEELATRYLKGMSHETCKTMEFLCSLPRVWTDDMVRYVYTNVISDEPYELYVRMNIKQVKEHSFVEIIDDSFKIHNTFRSAIRKVTEISELLKISETAYRFLLNAAKNPENPLNIRAGIMRALLSDFEEFAAACEQNSKKNPVITNGDFVSEALAEAEKLAGEYESSDIWGKYKEAVRLLTGACNIMEKYAELLNIGAEKLAETEVRIADDYYERDRIISSAPSFDAYIRYSEKALRHLEEVYPPDDWRVLYQKKEWIGIQCRYLKDDAFEEDAKSVFELVKSKYQPEEKKVFKYIYGLWNCTWEEDYELLSWLREKMPEMKDSGDSDIDEMLSHLEYVIDWNDFIESEAGKEFSREEDLRAEEHCEQEEREEKLAKEEYDEFIKNYSPEKNYEDPEIKELLWVVNALEHYFCGYEAYNLLKILYHIEKRQAGDKETERSIDILIEMANICRDEFLGEDFVKARSLLKTAQDALFANPDLKVTYDFERALSEMAAIEAIREERLRDAEE